MRTGLDPPGILDAMEEQWPPPGYRFTYRVEVNLESPELAYTMEATVPARPNDGGADIASFRYERRSSMWAKGPPQGWFVGLAVPIMFPRPSS